MDSLQGYAAGVEPLALLSRFRLDFHACLTARADELSELADVAPPQLLHQPPGRHHPAWLKQQQRQHRSLLRPA